MLSKKNLKEIEYTAGREQKSIKFLYDRKSSGQIHENSGHENEEASDRQKIQKNKIDSEPIHIQASRLEHKADTPRPSRSRYFCANLSLGSKSKKLPELEDRDRTMNMG